MVAVRSTLVDHRDVAEVVARPEVAALVAVHGDDGLAALDHEESGAAFALDRRQTRRP